MATSETVSRTLIRDDVGPREWMNFVKGVAIVMVVFFHAWLFLHWIGLSSVPRVKVILELFPIAAFFLIAGLFAGRQSSWTFAQLWRRRLLPYLYLYLLWSLLRFGFAWIMPVVRGDTGISARDPSTILKLFILPSSSYWFIYALALATLIAWLVRGLNPYLHLALAAVVSMLFLSEIINTGNGGWNGLGEKYFFFVAGMVLTTRIHEATRRTQPWHVVASGAVLAVLGVSLIFFRSNAMLLLAFPATIAALTFGISLSIYLVRLRPLKFVQDLGAQSFTIYILHLFVITVATVLLRPVSTLPIVQGLGLPLIIAVALVALVASIYLTRLATKVPWLFVPPFAKLQRRRERRARASAAIANESGRA